MKALHVVSFLLVVVGALNWGILGVTGKNVVEMVLGTGSITTVVYVLVGVAAVVEVVTHKKNCKLCGGK